MTQINDLTVRLLTTLHRVEQSIKPVNDYGDATGFCTDFERIKSDLQQSIDSLEARLSDLERRLIKINSYESEEEFIKDTQGAGLLSSLSTANLPRPFQK